MRELVKQAPLEYMLSVVRVNEWPRVSKQEEHTKKHPAWSCQGSHGKSSVPRPVMVSMGGLLLIILLSHLKCALGSQITSLLL